FLSWPRAHRDLHAFPTRRSSDIFALGGQPRARDRERVDLDPRAGLALRRTRAVLERIADGAPRRGIDRRLEAVRARRARAVRDRSEEHTSELQSRENLVCRLLLE